MVLSRIHKTGLEQELNRAEITGRLTVPEIADKARLLAAEGIVLLKNEGGTLPIAPDTRVAVFGRSAVDRPLPQEPHDRPAGAGGEGGRHPGLPV